MKWPRSWRRSALPILGALSLMGVLAGATLGVTLPGCSSDRRDDTRESITRVPEPDEVIDEELMIALSMAKNHHHKADVYLRDGKIEEAAAAVREILAIEFPAGAPEAEDVTADARARLATLMVARGRLDEAMTIVEEGIAAASRSSFFVGNLHQVKGEVLEARAALLDEAPEDDAVAREQARALRKQAIAAYDESNRIYEALLRQRQAGGAP